MNIQIRNNFYDPNMFNLRAKEKKARNAMAIH